MPKISVLLTSYNSEKYIQGALNSLINQSFKDFEIILIDDGSVDNTISIIQSFNDPRIKLFCKSNTGLIDSLNYGIKKCSSELIARFDSDDLCFKNRLETQYSNFNINDSVLASNAIIINDIGEIIDKTNFPTKESNIIKSLNNLNNCIIHPTVLINKGHLIKSGSYNLNYKYAEDYELWLRISKYGKIRLIKNPLLQLRKHSSNISHLNLETQLKNTIKALTQSKLTNNTIPEKLISEYIETFLKDNKSFDNHYEITNSIIQKNSVNYSSSIKMFINKIFYILNRNYLIYKTNSYINDINKRS